MVIHPIVAAASLQTVNVRPSLAQNETTLMRIGAFHALCFQPSHSHFALPDCPLLMQPHVGATLRNFGPLPPGLRVRG